MSTKKNKSNVAQRTADVNDVKTEASQKAERSSRSSWQTGNALPELKVPDGWTARWVRNDPINITRKLREGWQFCSELKYNVPGISYTEDLRSHQSDVQGGVVIGDVVGMMLSPELTAERKKWLEEQTRANTIAQLGEDSVQRREGSKIAHDSRAQVTVDGVVIN